MSAPARLASLDVLRAIAVMLVVGRHLTPPPDPGVSLLDGFVQAWIRGGWIGVDLFFVLSGFLVSGLLFCEYQRFGTVSVGRFLIRRGLKIYPAFYFFLAATILRVVVRSGYRALPMPALACEALFVQNYGPAVWWHTWSLAVEEHFYLLCALLIFWLTRRAKTGEDPYRSLPAIAFAVAALSLAARIANGLLSPYTNATHLYPTHLRLDGLMFGVCLSYLYHFRGEVLRSLVQGRERLLLALGLVLIAPAFVFQVETTFLIYTFGLTCLYLGSGLLVVVLVLRGLPETRFVRVLAFIGAYSYSIYLWHLMVKVETDRAFTTVLHRPPESSSAQLTYVVGTFLVGILMAKLVELPVLKLRDRLFPSRSVPLPPTRQAPVASAV